MTTERQNTYWCFTPEQLDEALAEWAGQSHRANPDEADLNQRIVRDFLASQPVFEAGMRKILGINT